MELSDELKKLINEAKNICVILSQNNEPESLSAALALFYTLKELGKNVNLIVEEFPEKLNFLVPPLDFISSPKNFVISIPRSLADISQIYYEKSEENLKIHLTVDRGQLKKDGVLFYFSDAKPDAIITLGIQDFHKQLSDKLDSFGFLLNSPIINIDNHQENLKFGNYNLLKGSSLSEIVIEVIKSIDEKLIKGNIANCLLVSLIIYCENFKSVKTNPEVFQLSGSLIRNGAHYQQIIENLYKATDKEINFLEKVFQNLKADTENNVSVATLEFDDFYNFAETEANFIIEKIKGLGIRNNMLVLWKSHASASTIKGFFYSKKTDLLHKIAESQPFGFAQGKKSLVKNDWLFISIPEQDIRSVKNSILKLLQ